MTDYVPSEELLERARTGDGAAIGRLVSRAESGIAEARPALARAYRLAGRAHVVGITGTRGSGKSSLIRGLAAALRESGIKVAILAVGPTSPLGGGASLADRIRMTDLADDPGVFIRSMAVRGATGGVPRGLFEAIDVLDIAGYDTILVETCDVGADPRDLIAAFDTAIAVMAAAPDTADPAVESGPIDIADILVASKADRPEAARMMGDLAPVIESSSAVKRDGDWVVPLVATSAVTGEGVAALTAALRSRRTCLQGAAGEERRRRTAEYRLMRMAEDILIERFREQGIATVTGIAARVARRDVDPYAAAVDALTVFMH